MNINEELFQSAKEMAAELAAMHGTLYCLINSLRTTELSPLQAKMVDWAAFELSKSQAGFFAKYADELGGTAPENN